MESKHNESFSRIFMGQKTRDGQKKYQRCAPSWAQPTSVASRIASLLYKYPNIPKIPGESMKHNSSRHKFQKP